jgi:hypothetical protein
MAGQFAWSGHLYLWRIEPGTHRDPAAPTVWQVSTHGKPQTRTRAAKLPTRTTMELDYRQQARPSSAPRRDFIARLLVHGWVL